MLYDIRTSPEQLKKLGEWVQDGTNMADVELVADDRMLLAEQGDSRMAWDLGGEPASDEYLAVAPLDPSRGVQLTPSQLVLRIRAQLTELRDRLPALGERDDEPTIMLEHVLDEWDAFEQEFGTAEES